MNSVPLNTPSIKLGGLFCQNICPSKGIWWPKMHYLGSISGSVLGGGLPENVGPNTLRRARAVRVFSLTLTLTLTPTLTLNPNPEP